MKKYIFGLIGICGLVLFVMNTYLKQTISFSNSGEQRIASLVERNRYLEDLVHKQMKEIEALKGGKSIEKEKNDVDIEKNDVDIEKNEVELVQEEQQLQSPETSQGDTCMHPLIVAAVNEHFFHQLVNLVGSLHLNEPGLKVLVYDLGLSQASLNTMKNWCGVTVKKFPFENYPSYVRDLGQFAWKPILLLDAVDNHYPCVLYFDSSVELRQDIHTIKEALTKDNYWFSTTEWEFPNHFSSFGLQYYKLTKEDFTGKDWEAAATFAGFLKDSSAYHKILVPWKECALEFACIAPSGSNRQNHRQDQTALNFLIYAPGKFRDYLKEEEGKEFVIHLDWSYFAWKDSGLPADPKYHIPVIIFTRRGGGGPYKQRVCVVDQECCKDS